MAHTSYVFTLTFLLWVSFSAQETFLLMKSFLRYFYIVFKEQFFLFPQAFPEVWWRWGESNSWPPACKAGALPAELHPQILVDTSLLTNIKSLVIFRMSRMSNLRLASYSPMCLLVTATSLPIAPLRFTISHRHAHTMFRIATQC